MNKNREGYLISETERQCTNSSCGKMFKKTSKTVTLCNKCNSERVKSTDERSKMLMRAKNRARFKNIEFNLTIEDINIPEYCPILNIKLSNNKGKSGGKKDSPALDKIDCTKGYIKGNVRVISNLANMMKSHATNEELITFANWINNFLVKPNELN